MSANPQYASAAEERAILEQLIEARGQHVPDEYVLLFTTGEGRFFPAYPRGPMVEAASGYVLTRLNEVYRFWLKQAPESQAAALTTWKRVESAPHWVEHPEYRRARAHLGLTA